MVYACGFNQSETGNDFEGIIKQLFYSAFVEYEEFCRFRRVLSTSVFNLSLSMIDPPGIAKFLSKGPHGVNSFCHEKLKNECVIGGENLRC